MSGVRATRRPSRLPRSRRSVASALVAVVALAIAVLVGIAAIQFYIGRHRTVLGDLLSYERYLSTTRWDGTAVLVTGIVVAALGLLALLAGVLPGRPQLVRLADPDVRTRAGITPAGLRADMEATALAVDGIVVAKAKVRRRSVRISAETPFTDRDGLAAAVREAGQQRVDALQPVRRLKVRARLRRGVSRKES